MYGKQKEELLIVTPTLGRSEYFLRTVDSVASIQMRHKHVVVAPNRLLGSLRASWPHLELVAESEQCSGLYSALNHAISKAGESWTHLTYLNDDDWVTPEFSSELRIAISRGQADLFYGRCRYRKQGDGTYGLFPLERNPRRLSAVFRGGSVGISQPGSVVSKDVWRSCGPFDLSYRLNADLHFLLKAAVRAPSYYVSRRIVSEFSVRSGQLSGSRDAVSAENIRIAGETAKDISSCDARKALFLFRLRNLPIYLRRLVASGSFKGAYG